MALSGPGFTLRSRSLLLGLVAALIGCATPAVRPDSGASIEDYAANLNGKSFSLSLKPGPRTALSLPIGITWLTDPVNQFCIAAGGQLKVFAEVRIDGEPLPSEFDCIKNRTGRRQAAWPVATSMMAGWPGMDVAV